MENIAPETVAPPPPPPVHNQLATLQAELAEAQATLAKVHTALGLSIPAKSTATQKPKQNTVNNVLVLGAAALFLATSLFLWLKWHYLGYPVVLIVNGYFILALIVAGRWASDDDHPNPAVRTSWFIPGRGPALLIVPLLLASLIIGFANIYVAHKVFGDSSRLSAVYKSFFTLGFGDYGVTDRYGRILVIAELSSGVLMLIGVLPLLVARISSFK